MATATMTKGLRQAAYEARSITLAEDHHLVHRARFIGQGVHGENLWQVPSKSNDGTVYIVHVWANTMGVTCGCRAGTYGQACGHAGCALLAERQKQAAERESGQSEGWRFWLNGGSWE